MRPKFNKFLSSDWFIAFILFLIFLLTNGYIYGWDDQHVEIPLLKRLIDPTLYNGDYYVESLVKNFPSYFYHVLAHFISVEQVPAAYFLLYLISRYFLFFWIYKFWLLISQRPSSAFWCTTMLILIGRVEEFLYRTFSHQESALVIIMAGIYFFYKERFLLASMILGLSTNIHAVYSLFPMMYLGFYLVWERKRYGWGKLFKSCLLFLIFAGPIFIRIGQKFHETALPPESPLLQGWLELYKIACPQNFVFWDIPLETIFHNLEIFIKATSKYLYWSGLYVFNILYSQEFRQDKKTQSVAITTLALLIVSFVFSYLWPSRFILDLNLVRTTQFLLFLLVGYTTINLMDFVKHEKIIIGFLSGIMLTLLRYADFVSFWATVFLSLLYFMIRDSFHSQRKQSYYFLIISLLSVIGIAIVITLATGKYSLPGKMIFLSSVNLLTWNLFMAYRLQQTPLINWYKNLFIVIPIAVMFVGYCLFHVRYLNIVKTGEGLWQLQRNWEDMQRFVKKYTPKNASLLVPHDMEMGGFRIHSERKILVCYRDCGIIGFDFKAAREWQRRIKDVAPFQVYIHKSPESAIINALVKYKVNYLVFMNYAQPKSNIPILEKIYENDVFSLYRVKMNPLNNSP